MGGMYMSSSKYSNEMRFRVAKEASHPENQGLEHIVAEKYGIQTHTVRRWRDEYMKYGEDSFKNGFSRKPQISERECQLEKENEALRMEVEILKKAAAFLANVKRD